MVKLPSTCVSIWPKPSVCVYCTSLHGSEWGGFQNPVPVPVCTMHRGNGDTFRHLCFSLAKYLYWCTLYITS